MKYISEQDIQQHPVDWDAAIQCIREACAALAAGDYAQPIKPYLRYGDLRNRIIAMPAYVGGTIRMAGIKWISSFPGNLAKGLPRAHAVVVLNEHDTGQPVGIIDSGSVSGIRTAAVSGLMLQEWLKAHPSGSLRVGMTGYGPIGRLHHEMLRHLLGDRMASLSVHDLRPEILEHQPGIIPCKTWQEAFAGAHIFLTCTVSKEPYINLEPEPGSLHLNVSLRDYVPGFRQHVDTLVVDSWAEVCRESTDVEKMHLAGLLEEQDTTTFHDFVSSAAWRQLQPGDRLMFNPMGMAVFDIAIGRHYLDSFARLQAGITL